MAFQLTLPTLLGVIIGGVAFVFCLAVALVVLSLRIKHRRQLARTNAAGERRLSRYPGGHLSITDEDVAQMPGTGAAMRESLCNRYTRASTYAPMASRESVEKQPSKNTAPSTPRSDTKALQSRTVVTEQRPVSASPVRPWPLPRRLTRANRPPAMNLHLPTPSAPDGTKDVEAPILNEKIPNVPRLIPRDEYSNTRGLHTYDGQDILDPSPEKQHISSPILRPRPLFHEKPRSISYGMISEVKRQNGSKSNQVSQEALKPATHSPGSLFPRSISLTSQGPGTLPVGPVPPLPAEALVIRRQRSRNASDSRQSLVAADSRHNLEVTSKLNSVPMQARSPTPAKTPKTSGVHFKQDQSVLDGSVRQTPTSPTVARTGTLKAPLDSRKPFQVNVQDSITRSNSSGLSESLLNHGWSRSVSNASGMKDASYTRSKTPAGETGAAHISVFDFGLPLRSDIDIGVLSQLDPRDSHVKRRSTSILRMISGNEQSSGPGPKDARPTSIATEVPIRWSTDILTKEISDHRETPDGVTKARQRSKRSHVKQQYTSTSRSSRTSNNIQIPDLSVVASQQPQAQSLRRPRIDPPAFRPPSKSTFDPQLTRTRQGKSPSPRANPGPSPYLDDTLAILTGHDDSDSSNSSLPSTPTRRPSQKRQPSATHPNRQRAIFDGPSKIAQWPLAGQHPAFSLGLRATNEEPSEKVNNIFRLDAQFNFTKNKLNKAADQTEDDNNVASSYRPPSLLYRFPSPPSPPFGNASGSGGNLNIPNKLHSYSQPNIQNPQLGRPPSSAHRSTRSKTTSSFITNTSNNHKDHEFTNRPNDQLRQSVLALRRMNSEISEPSQAGREHRRYLSLGVKDNAIFEAGADGDTGDFSQSGVQRMESTSSVTTVLNAPAPLLSSEREEKTVEKEMEKGGRAVVKGPRAMPGWLDESMMMSSTSSYAPTVAGPEQRSRNWFEGEEFSKLF